MEINSANTRDISDIFMDVRASVVPVFNRQSVETRRVTRSGEERRLVEDFWVGWNRRVLRRRIRRDVGLLIAMVKILIGVDVVVSECWAVTRWHGVVFLVFDGSNCTEVSVP